MKNYKGGTHFLMQPKYLILLRIDRVVIMRCSVKITWNKCTRKRHHNNRCNCLISLTWQGGHVGGQNNTILFCRICIKIKFSSQRRDRLLFLTTNMAAMTSHAIQQFSQTRRQMGRNGWLLMQSLLELWTWEEQLEMLALMTHVDRFPCYLLGKRLLSQEE